MHSVQSDNISKIIKLPLMMRVMVMITLMILFMMTKMMTTMMMRACVFMYIIIDHIIHVLYI